MTDSQTPKKIDMKIGDTAFMAPYWQALGTTLNDSFAGATDIGASYCMSYEKEGGKDELKALLRNLHKQISNAEVDGYEIVIGNGATQLLFAALNTTKSGDVYAKKPYWFRFPEMVDMAGKTFRSEERSVFGNSWFKNATEIVTYPSNPENRLYRPMDCLTNRIYDCCYHWPSYHDGMEKLSEDIMIFGLAKATGHAGSRIGWALVKDKNRAIAMAKYIEMTTGGVSVDAQKRAISLLNTQLEIMEREVSAPTCFDHGRSVLKYRWKQLLKYPNDLFSVQNGSGMFAWCALKEPIPEGKNAAQVLEEMTGIQALNGASSGGDFNDFRLNMGCSEANFMRFMEVIRKLSK